MLPYTFIYGFLSEHKFLCGPCDACVCNVTSNCQAGFQCGRTILRSYQALW